MDRISTWSTSPGRAPSTWMGPDTGFTRSKSMLATDADVDPGRSCPPDASCVSTVTMSPDATCRTGTWSRLHPWCTCPPLMWKDAEPTGADTAARYPIGATGKRRRMKPRLRQRQAGQNRTMRAMVYRGPYKVRVEEKDMPRIEHPNDAIVRVTLAAICGSDLHLYHGLMPDTRIGHTFGHEFIGVVDEVGPSVQNLQRGDRVMVPFNIYWGSCFFCARGLYPNCHNVNPNATAVGGIYGYSHTTGGYDGGQAEYVRVPFADVGPSKIPDWMEDEDAVLLTDALATGYFGAQLGDIK